MIIPRWKQLFQRGWTMTSNPSRNRNRPVGEPFTDALDLPGWEDQSIWGYDNGIGAYFAQLWRNDKDKGDPDFSIPGINPDMRRPECIALALTEILGLDSLTAVKALSITAPRPRMRPKKEILSRIHQYDDQGTYNHAYKHALEWAGGISRANSLDPWTPSNPISPTAIEVDAELSIVTAKMYSGQAHEVYGSIDEALWWVLNGQDT